MTFPAASKHVRVLEGARLVHRRVVGRQHLCRLHAEPLRKATLWTDQFRAHWEARFQALDSLLDEMQTYESKDARDGALASGMDEGMEACYQHLDAPIAR